MKLKMQEHKVSDYTAKDRERNIKTEGKTHNSSPKYFLRGQPQAILVLLNMYNLYFLSRQSQVSGRW